MGINGLLQALKPIAKQVHVRKYDGQRVAVDGYSWLHKGAYCCARELCEGIWTDKFVVYFMSRLQLLRTNGLEPTVVFDGGRLPIKGEEEESRHRARAEARDKAAAHLAAGNVAMAQECYQRCVDVTPAMAKQVIEELKAQGVAFLVAPYEADAQMAYLARSGAVQLVITEDSDLLAYGCPRVLYKLDKTGTGEEVSLSDLPNCPGLPLSGWTADQFLQLCVMAGCDFLAQMPGIGLKKAHGVLRKYRSFTKVVKMLRFNGTKVPPDYETRFQLALWAFRHARVYCTAEKALIHLAPLPGGGIGAADVDVPAAVVQLEKQQQDQRLDFLGPVLPPEVAQGIAEGNLDPNTHKPYDLAAIYAGCKRPPAHLAAQLAQLRPAADPAAAEQPFSSSEAAAAFSGGAVGKPRVGLSRRHAGQSGGSNRRWSGAATGPGAYPGGAHSGGSQPGGGASGGAKKRASLGIAKYFQKPAAAAAAAAAQAAPSSARAVGGAGSAQAAYGAPAQAAAAPAQAAVPAAQSIKQSIAKAISTLGQQLQQRQQQQQADKQELLQQLTQQQQQQQDEAPDDAGDVAFGLPPAKRHRSSGDLAAAGVAAQSLAAAAGADSHGMAAGDDNAAGDQALQQSMPNFDASLPISNSSLGLSGRSQSPAVDASMSAGLGSAGVLASGGSAGADLAASQPGSAFLSNLDPSFLCGSSDGLGSQQPRARGAAVSALSALFGPTAAAGAGGFNRASSPAGFEDNMNIGSSQLLMGAAAAGLQEPATSWDMQFNSSSGAVGNGGGGYFSQPAGFSGSGGSSGLLGSSSELGGSLDGCGSSSGLSLGALGVSTAGAAHGAALWDGAASVSFGPTEEQDMECEAAAAGGIGSNASFRRMQQSLRAAFKQPQQQQQQEAAADPGRSSFFSSPQQEQPEQPCQGRNNTARRHSRFKEQLLRGSPGNGRDDVLQESPDAVDAVLGLASDPQDSPDGLCENVDQLQLRGQQRLRVPGQHQAQAAAAAAAEEEDECGAVVAGTQRQRLQTPLLLSDSSEPSSGTTSNDENAEGADDALNHLGITHVKQYAKLAHKVVRTVAKQQQQQHVPLASRMGLLNTQTQWRPDTAALLSQQQQQRQHTAAELDGAGQDDAAADVEAAPAMQRMRMGLSRGGPSSSCKGVKSKAGAGAGSFAAKLAGLRYDASMFVPLDQHQQQRQQREQEEEQAEEEGGVLQARTGAGCARGMFGRHAGAAAAARKPFKAPWLAAKAALAEDSPSISDVLQNREPAAAGGEGTGAAGFGAFGGFACSAGGGTGAKRAGAQKRGAKFGLG